MNDRMPSEVLAAHGEVTDREDLLDGRVRVELEGDASGWTVEAGFGWRRARDGAIEVDAADSYLTLSEGETEVNAAVEAGTVTLDDTGAARLEVRLEVEDAHGDAAEGIEWIEATLSVGVAEWSGELRLGGEP